MTDEALIVASDPNAPQVYDIGEDGDYLVTNTQDPAVAERVLRAYVDRYDAATRHDVLHRLDGPGTTYTAGTYWWRDESRVEGAELVDIAKELPPAPFRGILITMDWLD